MAYEDYLNMLVAELDNIRTIRINASSHMDCDLATA